MKPHRRFLSTKAKYSKIMGLDVRVIGDKDSATIVQGTSRQLTENI